MPYIIDVDNINQTENAYPSPLVSKKTGLPLGTQCVALVQSAPVASGSSRVPITSMWHPGLWVHGTQPGDIKKDDHRHLFEKYLSVDRSTACGRLYFS